MRYVPEVVKQLLPHKGDGHAGERSGMRLRAQAHVQRLPSGMDETQAWIQEKEGAEA